MTVPPDGTARFGLLLLLLVLLSACGPGASSPPANTSAIPAGTGLAGGAGESRPSIPTPPRTTPAATTPPGNTPAREIAGTCPYISGTDVAQSEGDRFGHSTILTTTPVGCRFYWAYDDKAVITEITVRTYPNATDAYNAMVLTSKGHPEVVSQPGIGAGSVAFRAPLQGVLTWECVFAKGVHVVAVHTRQPDPSFNARALAAQVATRFR